MEFSSLAFKKEHFKMCTCDEFVTLGLTDLINICKNKASLHNSLKFFPIQILIVFLRLDCHPILCYSAADLKLGSLYVPALSTSGIYKVPSINMKVARSREPLL